MHILLADCCLQPGPCLNWWANPALEPMQAIFSSQCLMVQTPLSHNGRRSTKSSPSLPQPQSPFSVHIPLKLAPQQPCMGILSPPTVANKPVPTDRVATPWQSIWLSLGNLTSPGLLHTASTNPFFWQGLCTPTATATFRHPRPSRAIWSNGTGSPPQPLHCLPPATP